MNAENLSPNSLEQKWLAAQVLAFIIRRDLPNTTLVGGGIDTLGFYYDFLLEKPLGGDLLHWIELQMHQFVKEEHPVRSLSMMRENAGAFLEHHGHPLLAVGASEMTENVIALLQIDKEHTLCPPLSLTSVKDIGFFRLLEAKEIVKEIDGEEVSITRVFGISKKSAQEIKQFTKAYEKYLKKTDHRMLGPKLNLFSFSKEDGENPQVIWHPKGVALCQILQKLLAEKGEELSISTPVLDSYGELRSSALRQHLLFFQEMILPSGTVEFPWRTAESGLFHGAYEESKLWGLFCHGVFQGNETTICCYREQIFSEVNSSLQFIEQFFTILGFEGKWFLSISSPKKSQTKREREAVDWLVQTLQSQPRQYPFSPLCDGPVIHDEESETWTASLVLHVQDALGREWPVADLSVVVNPWDNTIAVQNEKQEQEFTVLTRRVPRSMDRLIALLIERYEGCLPLWLCSEQARVVAVGEANHLYAKQVHRMLRGSGFRARLDLSLHKLGVRVRQAEIENVPYLIFVGEQERVKQKICVRAAKAAHHNQIMDIETFLLTVGPRICYSVTDS